MLETKSLAVVDSTSTTARLFVLRARQGVFTLFFCRTFFRFF